MKKRVIVFGMAIVLVMAVSTVLLSQSANRLTDTEKTQGWGLLFNGRSVDGWRQCNGTAMPANWVTDNQAMKGYRRPLAHGPSVVHRTRDPPCGRGTLRE